MWMTCAGAHQWIDSDWERLQRFSDVWLCFDADDAGADAALLTKLEKAAAAAGKRYEKAHKAGA